MSVSGKKGERSTSRDQPGATSVDQTTRSVEEVQEGVPHKKQEFKKTSAAESPCGGRVVITYDSPSDDGKSLTGHRARDRWNTIRANLLPLAHMAQPSDAVISRAGQSTGSPFQKDVLRVPGTVTHSDSEDSGRDTPLPRSNTVLDTGRKNSKTSVTSRTSELDPLQNSHGRTQREAQEEGHDQDSPSPGPSQGPSTGESFLSTAIPFLPVGTAAFCLFINIFLPGIGTVLGGFCSLCCGKARIRTKEDKTIMTVCVNVLVGLAQLFTVTFLLVGWFWSVAWGILMVILAVENRRYEKEHKKKETQAKLLTEVFGDHLRPFTLRN